MTLGSRDANPPDAGRGEDAPVGPPAALAPPAATLRVCVVIPARDEEAGIAETLAALANQVDLDERGLDPSSFEVIVLANNCRDGTAAAARRFGNEEPRLTLHVVERTFPPAEAHIGQARRWLMEEAARRLRAVGHPRGVIATTDADTRVDSTWLAATLREFERGADAVCGRILSPAVMRNQIDPATRPYQLRDAAYRIMVTELEALLDPDPADPWPRHHQHFGASLAVTVETYRRAGGLPPIAALEDVAFHDALRRIDARIRHSPAVRVVTSSRGDGRVAVGLSTQLGEWAAMARGREPLLVEAPRSVEVRLRRRRALRDLWRLGRTSLEAVRPLAARIANAEGVNARWLTAEIAESGTFGRLRERLAERQRLLGSDREAPPLVDVRAAIGELRSRLAVLRRRPATDAHLWSLARSRPLAPTLQQIEPVRLLPAAGEVPEPAMRPRLGQEPVVDLVPG